MRVPADCVDAEPALVLSNCTLGPEGVTAVCLSSLDGTMVPVSYTCSYNGEPEEDCERACKLAVASCHCAVCHAGGPGPEIVLPPPSRFPPGTQVTLNVTVSTGGGQSQGSALTFTAQGTSQKEAGFLQTFILHLHGHQVLL